jgi:hypothetical protein
MPWRFHPDDRLVVLVLAELDLLQRDAARGRVGLEILETCCDVRVSAQRIEVVLLAVVDGRLVSHAPIRLIGIVVMLFGERIEHHSRRRHRITQPLPARMAFIT